MLLSYALAHCKGCSPKDQATVDKFVTMANRTDPGLKDRLPTYRQMSRDITAKIDKLKPADRTKALADLHKRVWGAVTESVKSGNVRPAFKAILDWSQESAKKYGVTITSAQLAKFPKESWYAPIAIVTKAKKAGK